MTDDEIDLRLMRAIARGVSSPMRQSLAMLMGIIPPRCASVDAGKPWLADGSDYSDLPVSDRPVAVYDNEGPQLAAWNEGKGR